MSAAKDLQTEREHSQYENALRNIEAIAQDGIESFNAEAKNKELLAIRELVEETL